MKKLNAENERTLIAQIKQKDNDALAKMCQKYAPMIMNVKRRFYLRDFDDDDWDQEARLICYESAVIYDEKRGYFGSYFKVRLMNHARTLLRYELAQRRAAHTHAVSYEQIMTDEIVNQKQITLLIDPISDVYRAYVKSLSPLEQISNLYELGLIDQEAALEKGKCTVKQLMQAKSRCKQKLKKLLMDQE